MAGRGAGERQLRAAGACFGAPVLAPPLAGDGGVPRALRLTACISDGVLLRRARRAVTAGGHRRGGSLHPFPAPPRTTHTHTAAARERLHTHPSSRPSGSAGPSPLRPPLTTGKYLLQLSDAPQFEQHARPAGASPRAGRRLSARRGLLRGARGRRRPPPPGERQRDGGHFFWGKMFRPPWPPILVGAR